MPPLASGTGRVAADALTDRSVQVHGVFLALSAVRQSGPCRSVAATDDIGSAPSFGSKDGTRPRGSGSV